MLINLEASNVNGFKMPYMPFQKSTVTVTELFIKFSQAVQVHGSVKSTLVDRNPFNPNQIIFMFCQEQASAYLHCKPTQYQTYKIQLTELQTAEFKIDISTPEKIAKIAKIFLQIKIDAGIQQGLDRSLH